MAKYDLAFKLAVVKAYLDGKGGYVTLAKGFNIGSSKSISQWVKIYQAFGENALEWNFKHKTYSVQFKLDVLNYKMRTGKSYQDVAIVFSMAERSLIANWMRVWKQKGIDGLSKTKGRSSMSKKKKISQRKS